MPVNLPGFTSYRSFLSLFSPLKKSEYDSFSFPQIELDQTQLESLQEPDTTIPVTEDCMRCIKQLIRQFAEIKQNEFCFRTLLHCFPQFPAEFINATYSLYMAVVERKHIDLAVLDTLGLAAGQLLNEGNMIARLAQFVRETIAEYVGEAFLQQFDREEDNHNWNAFFTALAVLSIALKYWMSDSAAPQRRVLQIPAFLCNLVVRANYYWQQLGKMAQHAAASCLMPVKDSHSWQCVEETIKPSQQKSATITRRSIWTCSELPQDISVARKSAGHCDFALSADTLRRVRDEGVLFSRNNEDRQNEGPVMSASSRHTGNTMALALPLIAGIGWTGAGQKVLGATVATFLGYAWYSMFLNSPPDTTTKNRGVAGALTDEELAILDSLAQELKADDPAYTVSPARQPFSVSELSAIQKIVADLAEKENVPAPIFYPLLGQREKRSVNPIVETVELTRQMYWEHKYQAAANNSAEKKILALLRTGPQPTGKYSLAAPRESFPQVDAWFTRMDQLHLDDFSHAFVRNLLKKSMAISGNMTLVPPIAGLSTKVWLHLGGYYQQLYKKVLHGWSKAILRLNAPLSAEYAIAVKQLKPLVEKLNDDWENSAIDPLVLANLTAQGKTLNDWHIKLKEFSTIEIKRIAEALKNETWGFSSAISTNGYIWSDYQLTYLDKIDLSAFTADFLSVVKEFILSNVAHYTKGGMIDLVDLYTGMNVIAIRRMLDAMQEHDVKKAYNYAMLDEQLLRIIKENIARLWKRRDLSKFLRDYNTAVIDALPYFWHMRARLQSERDGVPLTPPPIPEVATKATDPSFPAILTEIEWYSVSREAERVKPLPSERFNAQGFIHAKFKEKIDDIFNTLINFTQNDLLNPDIYIDKWIVQTLKQYGAGTEWTPDSLLKVSYRKPSFYSLRDFVRGQYRHDEYAINTAVEIDWPSSFSQVLRDRLYDGIFSDISQGINSLFSTTKGLTQLYNVMIRRAALNYFMRKNAIQTTDYYHHLYLKAVEFYLKGKIEAQLVKWHGAPVSGLIYIPAEKAAEGALADCKIGVLLSLWNNDYYEVPWPGLAQDIRKEGRTGRWKPAAKVESEQAFRDFMEKHRTPRNGARLAKVEDAFGYDAEINDPIILTATFTQIPVFTRFHAPVSLYTPDKKDIAGQLISLHHEDMEDLYKNLIYTQQRFDRAVRHELLNTLTIMAGVLLMGAGIAFGGPAWVWVVASMATTLLLDVTPRVMLYSQADSDDERDLYMRSIMMAIAFELGGNIITQAATPLLKIAVYRFARLGSTTMRTTIPKMYDFTVEKLKRLIEKSGVLPVRKVKENVMHLTREAKDDLESVMLVRNKPAQIDTGTQTDAASAIKAKKKKSKKAIEKDINEPPSFLLGRADYFNYFAEEIKKMGFKTSYRVVTQWKTIGSDAISNSFWLTGQRGPDNVIIQIMEEGGDITYIYRPEDEWIKGIVNEGKLSGSMIAYTDFKDADKFSNLYHDLTLENSHLHPFEYPKDGFLLFVPEGFEDMMSSMGLKYGQLQELIELLQSKGVIADTEQTLSLQIKEFIQENKKFHHWIQEMPLYKAPTPLDETAMKALVLNNYGPDIEKFSPLPNNLPFMEAPKNVIKKRIKVANKSIRKFKGLKTITQNFQNLKTMYGKGVINPTQVTRLESAFNKAYIQSEQLSALLQKTKNDLLIRKQVIVVLAQYLNTTSPRILGEAFQRLDELASRLYDIAHFQVIEQQLKRVIPMKNPGGITTVAFVVREDPLARMMIVLPNLMDEKDVAGMLLHEMMHHAVGAEDFSYIHNMGYPNIGTHHARFGATAFLDNSPHAVLGRTQQRTDQARLAYLEPLTDYERALAQARVRYLPMLNAYAKMNNADSLVVLINELIKTFNFRRIEMSSPARQGWEIVLGYVTRRTKREQSEEQDMMDRQLKEDILAGFLMQSLDMKKEDILCEEEMEKYGLELTEAFDISADSEQEGAEE